MVAAHIPQETGGRQKEIPCAQFQKVLPKIVTCLSLEHCAASIVCVTDGALKPKADPDVIIWVKLHFCSIAAPKPPPMLNTAALRENKNKSRDYKKDVFLKSTSVKGGFKTTD